ncbi:efflux transporter outer membrane subunit [Noviherbaspirillum cavernae]|uniref:Efflux transporter outer membrane subunit n=1 Tax=Noviherbaspirillum cavernae TaxID=2320862 RepID=A0A418X671_9BURK|nr:efflux transporter outer membrane subunit [Noviherbaspirillum cavernae]RJG07987.1 efflux transporter outer membrane subunit [Noviherbaspirillum cavernae]
MRNPALLLIAATLSACAVGPDYRRPDIDMPEAFRFEDKEAQDVANTIWWEQFQDPAMNELIAIALAENKDVKIAAARVDQFLGQFASTRSLLFPQVGASFNAQRQRATQSSVPPLSSGIDPIFNQYDAALSLSWEIDVFGKLRRQTEAARANVLASEEGRRATILTLVAAVASSYINLRDLDRQLEIARATADSRGNSLKVFQLRFEGGTVSQLELAQNQSEYEGSLIAIPRIESLIAQQEDALSVLLGRNPGPIRRGRELPSLVLPAVPSGLPSELLVRRPDLRQAEQNLIAANALIGAARAQYFPSISLTGLLGSVSSQFSDLFTGPARAWSYGAGVTMPIFTAGGIAGQVQQAQAQQQQALLQYQKSIQVAFQEVSDSLVAHRKTREQLEAQGRQVDALRNYVTLARLRYDNGYTSFIEVLDAERSLFAAELSQSQTQGAVYASLINLYKAMGGGWVVEAERMAASAAVPAKAD